MNSVCGRMMKKQNSEYHIPIDHPYQILERLEDIKGFSFEGDTLVAQIKSNYGPRIQDPHNQMVLGAYITSYGRLALDDLKTKIKSAGGGMIYTDTDSCFFVGKKNLDKSNFGSALGEYKNDIQDAVSIESFVCLGPKRYAITYKNGKGEFKQVVKFCGLRPPAEESGKELKH